MLPPGASKFLVGVSVVGTAGTAWDGATLEVGVATGVGVLASLSIPADSGRKSNHYCTTGQCDLGLSLRWHRTLHS